MEKSMDEIKKYIIPLRDKKQRLRTIFLHLRNLDRYESWSDIILLNSISFALRELGLPFSKHEVYAAFKEVDKEEYCLEDKRILLKNLIENLPTSSVFNHANSCIRGVDLTIGRALD